MNNELASRSRLADYALSPRASAAAQLALLIALGALAAILTSIAASPLPLIGGLSLAPRRGAGSIMSVAAMIACGVMSYFGATRVPFAAVAGLAMLGPLLDLVTTSAANLGWRLYVRFAATGLAANLIAFAVRFATGATAVAGGGGHSGGTGRGMGLGGGGRGTGGYGLQLAQVLPWSTMLLSFALFGALAGLACGLIWFRANPRRPQPL